MKCLIFFFETLFPGLEKQFPQTKADSIYNYKVKIATLMLGYHLVSRFGGKKKSWKEKRVREKKKRERMKEQRDHTAQQAVP